jgi:hypothetical protein
LDQGGHDPGRLVIEVYDDPQPAPRVDVAAVEVLSARKWNVRAMIGMSDSPEDEIDLVHDTELGEAADDLAAAVEREDEASGLLQRRQARRSA